jgi:hypothetical protein
VPGSGVRPQAAAAGSTPAQIREELAHSGVPFMSAQIGQRVAFIETPSVGFPAAGSVAALEIELLAKELRRRLKA